MSRHVFSLNAGSSSIKFALFELDGHAPLMLAAGQVEMLGECGTSRCMTPTARRSLRISGRMRQALRSTPRPCACAGMAA